MRLVTGISRSGVGIGPAQRTLDRERLGALSAVEASPRAHPKHSAQFNEGATCSDSAQGALSRWAGRKSARVDPCVDPYPDSGATIGGDEGRFSLYEERSQAWAVKGSSAYALKRRWTDWTDSPPVGRRAVLV